MTMCDLHVDCIYYNLLQQSCCYVQAWHQIGIDLVGPLPETPNGNKYICTITDYYTKWAEATALPSKEAVGVANFLYKVIENVTVISTEDYFGSMFTVIITAFSVLNIRAI